MSSWPGFDMRREVRPDAIWLLVAGELDIGQAERLEAEIAEAAASGRTLIVDLTGVTFCDSSGLAALLRAKRAHAAMRYAPGDAVVDVAKLGCVDDVLFAAAPAVDASRLPADDAASQ